MRSDCVRAVTEAAAKVGKSLTQADFNGIEKRVRQASKELAREDPDRWRGLSPGERANEAGEHAAKILLMEKAKDAANVARQIIAHDTNQTFIDGMAMKGMSRVEAIQRMVVDYLDNKAGFQTMSSVREGVLRTTKGNMEKFASITSKYLGFFADKAMIRDVWREFYGDDTGNAKARHVVDTWMKQIAEPLRKQANELGASIGKIKGHYIPQSHSMWKVAAAKIDKWIDFVIDRLDKTQYVHEDGRQMTDAEIRRDVLVKAYDSISTDGASSLDGSEGSGGSIKNRGQDPRVLHFKDAKSYMEYQKLYGEKSLLEQMNSHIDRMANTIAALKVFGPNAEAGLKALLDDAQKRDTTIRGLNRDKVQKGRDKAEINFALQSGKMGPMGDPNVAHRFQQVRSTLAGLRLGKAALSAITDDVNGIAMTRSLGVPFPVLHWLKTEMKVLASPALRREMRENGIAVDAITHGMSRYGEDVFGHGISGNFANMVFRITGLNFIDALRRETGGVVAFHRYGELAREFETIDHAPRGHTGMARIREAGVSAKTWAVWREAAQAAGDGMLTPLGIQRLANRSANVRRDAMQALVGATAREIDTIVPMPSAKARGTVEYQLRNLRGTVGGELARTPLQFKSFAIAMMSNHWQRLIAQPTPGGKALYVAELVATGLVFGGISQQLKSLASGNNLQDATDPKFWGRAFVQGGVTGLVGDLLINPLVSPYKQNLTDQMGPVMDSLSTAYELYQATLNRSAKPDAKVNLGGNLVHVLEANIPFANLWWTQAAFRHLVFQRLQDYYSPGYANRMRARTQKDYGSQPYWPPSTAASPTQLLSTRGLTAPNMPDPRTLTGAQK